ncbi:hypothetical protein ASPVEDRAFT_43486 [Aspergillus versicolor CBS 583.65]|uniref:Secreted protein n=1 Tax=Aspergillus versicolor CBS 583.65 TaxID=1036611 RepID=A0A1L9PRI8_ASPVE|nr:uncharacterized protein ASPVEDRAFT_43486 [Aspergillus versicolor CBS 583.65]OJJ04045.1 hypothetical protein ASPVEDRAFT_43486 [Aspergillus versicolor CBS 583.65]
MRSMTYGCCWLSPGLSWALLPAMVSLRHDLEHILAVKQQPISTSKYGYPARHGSDVRRREYVGSPIYRDAPSITEVAISFAPASPYAPRGHKPQT